MLQSLKYAFFQVCFKGREITYFGLKWGIRRVSRSGPHTPTQISVEYLPGARGGGGGKLFQLTITKLCILFLVMMYKFFSYWLDNEVSILLEDVNNDISKDYPIYGEL